MLDEQVFACQGREGLGRRKANSRRVQFLSTTIRRLRARLLHRLAKDAERDAVAAHVASLLQDRVRDVSPS